MAKESTARVEPEIVRPRPISPEVSEVLSLIGAMERLASTTAERHSAGQGDESAEQGEAKDN